MSGMRHFVVEGKGHFPFDMLRYDLCWPRTSSDAEWLHAPLKNATKVQLTTVSANGPTEARWESFGWRVVEVRT